MSWLKSVSKRLTGSDAPAKQQLSFTFTLVGLDAIPEGYTLARIFITDVGKGKIYASPAARVPKTASQDSAAAGHQRQLTSSGARQGVAWAPNTNNVTFRINLTPEKQTGTGTWGWKKREILVALQLQRSPHSSTWIKYGNPIVINLALHATAPFEPGDNPMHHPAQHMYTPLTLVWQSPDFSPSSISLEALLTCVSEGCDDVGSQYPQTRSETSPVSPVRHPGRASAPGTPELAAPSPTAHQDHGWSPSPRRLQALSASWGPKSRRHSHNQIIPAPGDPDTARSAHAAEQQELASFNVSSPSNSSMPPLELASVASTPRTEVSTSMPPLEIASSLSSTPAYGTPTGADMYPAANADQPTTTAQGAPQHMIDNPLVEELRSPSLVTEVKLPALTLLEPPKEEEEVLEQPSTTTQPMAAMQANGQGGVVNTCGMSSIASPPLFVTGSNQDSPRTPHSNRTTLPSSRSSGLFLNLPSPSTFSRMEQIAKRIASERAQGTGAELEADQQSELAAVLNHSTQHTQASVSREEGDNHQTIEQMQAALQAALSSRGWLSKRNRFSTDSSATTVNTPTSAPSAPSTCIAAVGAGTGASLAEMPAAATAEDTNNVEMVKPVGSIVRTAVSGLSGLPNEDVLGSEVQGDDLFQDLESVEAAQETPTVTPDIEAESDDLQADNADEIQVVAEGVAASVLQEQLHAQQDDSRMMQGATETESRAMFPMEDKTSQMGVDGSTSLGSWLPPAQPAEHGGELSLKALNMLPEAQLPPVVEEEERSITAATTAPQGHVSNPAEAAVADSDAASGQPLPVRMSILPGQPSTAGNQFNIQPALVVNGQVTQGDTGLVGTSRDTTSVDTAVTAEKLDKADHIVQEMLETAEQTTEAAEIASRHADSLSQSLSSAPDTTAEKLQQAEHQVDELLQQADVTVQHATTFEQHDDHVLAAVHEHTEQQPEAAAGPSSKDGISQEAGLEADTATLEEQHKKQIARTVVDTVTEQDKAARVQKAQEGVESMLKEAKATLGASMWAERHADHAIETVDNQQQNPVKVKLQALDEAVHLLLKQGHATSDAAEDAEIHAELVLAASQGKYAGDKATAKAVDAAAEGVEGLLSQASSTTAAASNMEQHADKVLEAPRIAVETHGDEKRGTQNDAVEKMHHDVEKAAEQLIEQAACTVTAAEVAEQHVGHVINTVSNPAVKSDPVDVDAKLQSAEHGVQGLLSQAMSTVQAAAAAEHHADNVDAVLESDRASMTMTQNTSNPHSTLEKQVSNPGHEHAPLLDVDAKLQSAERGIEGLLSQATSTVQMAAAAENHADRVTVVVDPESSSTTQVKTGNALELQSNGSEATHTADVVPAAVTPTSNPGSNPVPGMAMNQQGDASSAVVDSITNPGPSLPFTEAAKQQQSNSGLEHAAGAVSVDPTSNPGPYSGAARTSNPMPPPEKQRSPSPPGLPPRHPAVQHSMSRQDTAQSQTQKRAPRGLRADIKAADTLAGALADTIDKGQEETPEEAQENLDAVARALAQARKNSEQSMLSYATQSDVHELNRLGHVVSTGSFCGFPVNPKTGVPSAASMADFRPGSPVRLLHAASSGMGATSGSLAPHMHANTEPAAARMSGELQHAAVHETMPVTGPGPSRFAAEVIQHPAISAGGLTPEIANLPHIHPSEQAAGIQLQEQAALEAVPSLTPLAELLPSVTISSAGLPEVRSGSLGTQEGTAGAAANLVEQISASIDQMIDQARQTIDASVAAEDHANHVAAAAGAVPEAQATAEQQAERGIQQLLSEAEQTTAAATAAEQHADRILGALRDIRTKPPPKPAGLPRAVRMPVAGLLSLLDGSVRQFGSCLNAGSTRMLEVLQLHSSILSGEMTLAPSPTSLATSSYQPFKTQPAAEGQLSPAGAQLIQKQSGQGKPTQYGLLILEVLHEAMQLPPAQAALGLGSVLFATTLAAADTMVYVASTPMRLMQGIAQPPASTQQD